MSDDFAQRLARLEAGHNGHVDHCAERWAEVRKQLEAMAASAAQRHEANVVRLGAIETTLAEARGGWKYLVAAGSIGAAIASAVAALLKFMGKF